MSWVNRLSFLLQSPSLPIVPDGFEDLDELKKLG